MAKLVQDLITVSELSTTVELNTQPTDLKSLLQETMEYIRSEADGRGLDLELAVVGDDPLIVEADPSRVYQILEHLLHNACRFTEEGGRIQVRAQERVYDDQRQVVVSVSDTGVGIPLEEQERIFDPFYQIGGDVQEIDGAGVGLTIARGLVEAQGGRLWVESRPGKGSTFSFTLPVPQEE
jgi:histidine kinase